jgi:integrase
LKRWLSEYYGKKSASYYNSALTVVRAAFDVAVNDKIISGSPVKDLTCRKRNKAIRLTPIFEQFKANVPTFAHRSSTAKPSKAATLSNSWDWPDSDRLTSARLLARTSISRPGELLLPPQYRHWLTVPIYPQLRSLVEKLCRGKEHDERLFTITEARKALRNACKRLGFPQFTHRSLRRMFITRTIEKGIDVKVISEWQGHRDRAS